MLKHRQETIMRGKATATKSKSPTALKNILLRDDSDDSMEEDEDDMKKPKKKDVQITIQATCLSIELRDEIGHMICEFCMVNFDYGFQLFSDEVMNIYMKVHSLFIFHDENPLTNEKSVMFGHLNCLNNVVTNEDFYLYEPEKLITAQQSIQDKQEMTKYMYDPTHMASKNKIGFSLLIDPKKKKQTIKIKLHQLKFFVMPYVFKDISDFAITALKKLDLKTLQAKQFQDRDPVAIAEAEEEAMRKAAEALGNRFRLKMTVTESILVLERRERSKKAVVVEMDFGMNLNVNDQIAIEQAIASTKLRHTGSNKKKFFIVQRMNINVNKLAPYIVNILELEGKNFRSTKKRLMMTGLTCTFKMEGAVSRLEQPESELLDGQSPALKFKNKNDIDVAVSAFSANLSMDDFYVVTSISRKITEDGMDLAKVWVEYADKDVISDEFKEYKKDVQVPPETHIDFVCDGAEFIIINEEKGNFVPLFLAQCDSVKFTMGDGHVEAQSEAYGETSCSMNYFNANSGYWEPVVEKFAVMFKLATNKKKSLQSVHFLTPFNINASVDLARSLSEFQRLWNESKKKSLKFAKKIKAGHKSVMQQSMQIINKMTSKGGFTTKRLGGAGIMFMEEEESGQDIVSPYAIRNLTDRTIKVYSLADGSDITTNFTEIAPSEMKDLAVNISTLQQNQGDGEDAQKEKVLGQDIGQKSQFVRIEFEKQWMRPIPRINLNQGSAFFKHKIVDSAYEIGSKYAHREDYVIQNALEDNKRILTVRTQHILTNRTQSLYQVRQFYVDKSGPEKKAKTVFFGDLKPGESMPIPDYKDPVIQENLKIAIRPETCRKWSEEYKIAILKTKLTSNQNILWGHYTTFSILRKETTRQQDVFNFVINPAMIVKNCLPVPISMLLSQDQKTEEELKQNNRQTLQLQKQASLGKSLTKKSSDKKAQKAHQSQMVVNSGTGLQDASGDQFDFAKGEEKYIDQIKMTTKTVNLEVLLNQQFKSQVLKLTIDNPAEVDLQIKYVDKENRSFNINARIETSKAGLAIIFYAKNVLLCHTLQPLQFFYEKKQGVFEQDNAHEFPSPVQGYIHTKDESNDQSAIYIFDQQPHMCAALVSQPNNKSDVVGIGTPGNTGNFSIPVLGNLYEFSSYTGLYQPSEKDLLFTKIVEVSPHFIAVNMTSKTLWFCQSYCPIEERVQALELKPKERQPYHWSSKDQPHMTHFFVEGAVKPTAQFTLSEAGSLNVANLMEDGSKQFFKVTKRSDLNSIFVIIEDMKSSPYKIDNFLSDMDVSYCQVGSKDIDEIEICKAGSSETFAWPSQQSQYLLNVEFLFQGTTQLLPEKPQDPNNKKKNKDLLEFSLDTLNATQCISLVGPHEQIRRVVYVSVYVNEKSKVIEFTEDPSTNIFETGKDKRKVNMEESKDLDDTMTITMIDENEDPNIEQSHTSLDLPSITMSFINSGQEIFTTTVSKLQAFILQKTDEVIYEMSIDRMQIDNQCQQEPIFPVVLKPKCTVPADQEHDHFSTPLLGVDPIMQFYVSMKTNIPNVTYITLFEFLVKELELKVEVEHMYAMLEYGSAIGNQFNTGITDTHNIFLEQITKKKDRVNETSNTDSMMFESQDIEDTVLLEDIKAQIAQDDDDEEEESKEKEVVTWRSNVIAQDAGIIYIQKYSGSPVSIDVSMFKQTRTAGEIKEKRQEGGGERSNKALRLVQDFGFKLSSITDAPMKLNSLEIENVYGPQNVVQAQLQDHYMSNLKANALRLVGSSDLIGNPTDFVNTLGTGVKSFYYEPRDGFMKGPLQGGIGLIKGTGSLAAHVVGGLAGSVSKVTNTLNKGLLQLSGDTEYIHKKEIKDIRHKPTGALDGFGKGVKGLGTSIWGGVTGIVTKPVQGAKQDGVGGFFKGVGMGVAGAVVKPVSGVVDLVSKTNEGIESAVDGSACKPNNNKFRRPRAFYKESQIFQEYNTVEAAAFIKLQMTGKNKFKAFASHEDPFYAAVKLGENVGNDDNIDSPILMLTKNSIVVFNPQFEVVWMREQQDLAAVDIAEEARLAVTWIEPPRGKAVGDSFNTWRFANGDRTSKVDKTVREIAQVREFEASTNQGRRRE